MTDKETLMRMFSKLNLKMTETPYTYDETWAFLTVFSVDGSNINGHYIFNTEGELVLVGYW